MPASVNAKSVMKNARLTALGAACAIVLSGGLLTGCFKEGGTGFSNDRFVYVSRTWSPKTVTVIDTRTGEQVWTLDVPVGRQLVVDFEAGKNPGEYMPDTMHWRVMQAGKKSGDLTSTIPAPPSHARRVELSLRPAPETVDTILSSGDEPESEDIFVPTTGVTSEPGDIDGN